MTGSVPASCTSNGVESKVLPRSSGLGAHTELECVTYGTTLVELLVSDFQPHDSYARPESESVVAA